MENEHINDCLMQEGGPVETRVWLIEGENIYFATHIAGYSYWIEFSKCNNPRKLTYWINHLSSKSWVAPDMIADLVNLVTGDPRYQEGYRPTM